MWSIWAVFAAALIWFSVTMPKLFQSNLISGRVADLASAAAEEVLVKTQPKMEQDCVKM